MSPAFGRVVGVGGILADSEVPKSRSEPWKALCCGGVYGGAS